MTRYSFGFICALALGVVGCSEAGPDLCEGVECQDDGNECSEDVCNPVDGMCGVPVEAGTACSGGACLDVTCTVLTTVSGTVILDVSLEEDRPAAGATVSVLGTSLSTTTDQFGRFSFGVFAGDWFFQESKEGTWGNIQLETVPPTGLADLELEIVSDALVAEVAEILMIDIDDAKGWVGVSFGSILGEGGETATLSEPYVGALTPDADDNLVLSDKLLPGGGHDLEFLNVGVTEELTVTPMGVDGVDTCELTYPGTVYPVKAKFSTEVAVSCTPFP